MMCVYVISTPVCMCVWFLQSRFMRPIVFYSTWNVKKKIQVTGNKDSNLVFKIVFS